MKWPWKKKIKPDYRRVRFGRLFDESIAPTGCRLLHIDFYNDGTVAEVVLEHRGEQRVVRGIDLRHAPNNVYVVLRAVRRWLDYVSIYGDPYEMNLGVGESE